MKPDEYEIKKSWCNQAAFNVQINGQILMESVLKNSRKVERQILFRDLRETLIAIALIIFFGYELYKLPQVLAKFGSGTIIASCALIIYRLLRARQISQNETVTSEIRQNLEISLQKTRKQIKLLNSVIWWYLFPIFTGMIIFNIPFLKKFYIMAGFVIFLATIFAWIYFLNKRAVKKYLMPMEENLRQALKEISGENPVIE